VQILWQGFVDPTVHDAYTSRLRTYLSRVADPGTELEVRGLSPPDRHLHRMTEARCALQAVAAVIRAEEEGFDAAIIGHFQDSGLWEARAAVDMPVIGLGESSMLHACSLGSSIGLITISPVFIRWHEEQVLRYRLEQRVVAVRATDTSVDLFMQAFEEQPAYEEIKRQFIEQAAPMAAAGVEVIIPAGGLPALLFRNEERFSVDGALVLNPTPVALGHAELAVRLRAQTGTGASRHSTFAPPSPEAREEFLNQVGDHVSVQ
jgi:allantoin racemase